MKLPKFDETEIEVVDGVIVITQYKSYSSQKIEIPVHTWFSLTEIVDEALDGFNNQYSASDSILKEMIEE